MGAGGEKWNSSKNRVVNRVELDPDTKIRLIRAHCLRLVTEGFREDSEEPNIRIYYSVENTREYQEIGPQFMEVEDLPMSELDSKMKVVQDLWEKKLLLTK